MMLPTEPSVHLPLSLSLSDSDARCKSTMLSLVIFRAAAKKKGVNPALFSSGIKAKTTARGGGRKPLKGDGSGRRNDGSTIFNKPWEASSKANIAKSRGLVLSARWGSKDRPGAPKNYLQGGRAKK